MANFITCIRIVCAVGIVFFPPLSPAFYALYITAGISDMIDGTVARKTHTVTPFGSKLDTLADIVLFAVCAVKLLPVMKLTVRLYIPIAVIALLKVINLTVGFALHGGLTAEHTVPNKITGILLFLLPLTMKITDVKYTVPVVCVSAAAAAVHEFYLIVSRKKPE